MTGQEMQHLRDARAEWRAAHERAAEAEHVARQAHADAWAALSAMTDAMLAAGLMPGDPQAHRFVDQLDA